MISNSVPELIDAGDAHLRSLLATRRGGFFFSDRALSDLFGTRFGLIVKPETMSLIYRTILDRHCPHAFEARQWTQQEILTAVHGFEPAGLIGVEILPCFTFRFQVSGDLIFFRMLLPTDLNIR